MEKKRFVVGDHATSSYAASASSSQGQPDPCAASTACGEPAPQGTSGDGQALAGGSLRSWGISGCHANRIQDRDQVANDILNALDKVIQVRRSYNLLLKDLPPIKANGLHESRVSGTFSGPKSMDKGITLRSEFINIIQNLKNLLYKLGIIRVSQLKQGARPSSNRVL